ncbi:MAG: SMC-Scp complex subunit ScpB [Xanthomonadaceae bacterium]|nr:SMC-Scp complex subunit ScpB [Xanthomonadaceae bacterium]
MTKNKDKKNEVTFISDPFNMNHALDEVTDLATELDNEPALELDPIEETDKKLSSLAATMEEEHEKNVAELAALAKNTEAESAKELAAQIAEDVALEAALKAEEEAEATVIDDELRAALPSRDESGNIDVAEMESCIEAILFMSDKPVSLAKLRSFIGEDFEKELFTQAIESMKVRYSAIAHGFELLEIAGGYQLRTKPGRSALAKKLAKITTQRLSRGAMESLTIIAYKQPVMKEELDKIRGVDSSHFIRTLLDKKLIEISGRSELPGRPMVYATSNDFLEIFGLNSLADMPPLREIEEMVPGSETQLPDEDPRAAQIRKMLGQMKLDPERISYNAKEDEQFLSDIREKVKAIPISTPYLESLQNEAAIEASQSAEPPTQLL